MRYGERSTKNVSFNATVRRNEPRNRHRSTKPLIETGIVALTDNRVGVYDLVLIICLVFSISNLVLKNHYKTNCVRLRVIKKYRIQGKMQMVKALDQYNELDLILPSHRRTLNALLRGREFKNGLYNCLPELS